MSKAKGTTLPRLLKRIFDLDYFHPEGEEGPAIPHLYVKGKGRLVVVTGDNAGGKSFFRRLVQLVCRDAGIECMAISVQGRVTSSVARPFIYGGEEWQSTGQNSVNTVLTGIRTCQSRTTPHVMFWDEPDIGLSESWAAGVGQKIAAFGKALPEHTVAAIVVTHSKALLSQLVGQNPHFIHFGSETPPPSLRAWLDAPVVPRDPEELPKLSVARFRRIERILKRNKP